jgi:hypothetical protein
MRAVKRLDDRGAQTDFFNDAYLAVRLNSVPHPDRSFKKKNQSDDKVVDDILP